MSSMIYYRINSPNVISEIIEGEAVLVNLENGIYYSMDNVGAYVWECIEQGRSADQTVAEISSRYEGDPTAIESGVRQLIDQLRAEQLITPLDQPPTEINQTRDLNSSHEKAGKTEYIEPVLLKYTDMEDLLLLDPIHEVDDEGWPNQPLETE